jgi:hypothetical protein
MIPAHIPAAPIPSVIPGLRPYVHDHDPEPWRIERAAFTDRLVNLVPDADKPLTGIHVFRHHEEPQETWEGMPAWVLSDRGAASTGHAAALTVVAVVMLNHDGTILFDAYTRGMDGLTVPELGRMLQAVQLFYATFPDGEPLSGIVGRVPYRDPGRVPSARAAIAAPDPDEVSGVRRPWGRFKGTSPERGLMIALAEAARRGHTPVRRNRDDQTVWRGWCETCHMDLVHYPASMGGDCLTQDCPTPKNAEKEGE